jgi:hypothetical protein
MVLQHPAKVPSREACQGSSPCTTAIFQEERKMTRRATVADYNKRKPKRIQKLEFQNVRYNLKRSKGTKNGTNY